MRSMRIGLVTAAYPPDLDGIGDYTWWMAKTMVEQGHEVTILTRHGAVTEISGVTVIGFYDSNRPESVSDLAAALDSRPRNRRLDWLVLQYNPFSWGRRGFCPAVPLALSSILRKPEHPRIAVMLHETTVPAWPWKFAIMRIWQRIFLKSVCRVAHHVFISTVRWMPEIRPFVLPDSVSVLPVGANIPRSTLDHQTAKARLSLEAESLVIGIFGGAHVSRRLDWIAETATAISAEYPKSQVVHVGPDGVELRKIFGDQAVRYEGILEADKVADRLRAMDLLLSPFIDGVSTRRGSVMAALANGVPVATTKREWTDEVFSNAPIGCVLLSKAKTAKEFANEVVDWTKSLRPDLGASIEAFSEHYFGWAAIAESMTHQLAAVDSRTDSG